MAIGWLRSVSVDGTDSGTIVSRNDGISLIVSSLVEMPVDEVAEFVIGCSIFVYDCYLRTYDDIIFTKHTYINLEFRIYSLSDNKSAL